MRQLTVVLQARNLWSSKPAICGLLLFFYHSITYVRTNKNLGMSESNVCIGDQVRVGPAGSRETGGENGCLLEVSLPRQPCFKLNQRFGIKNFAPKTWQLAITGWYYRVVQEGWIEAGMEIKVVERRNPDWTIKRIHHYVHNEKKFLNEMYELFNMPELGHESKSAFKALLRKEEDGRKKANAPPAKFRRFRLIGEQTETSRISSFRLETVQKAAEEEIKNIRGGSNVLLKLPNGLQRAYSVVKGNTDSFTLGIAKEDKSRGGSIYLHDSTSIGDIIEVGPSSQNISPASMASHHIFIIGGIGITAFLGMVNDLVSINYTFEVHNCVRSIDDIAFSSYFEKHEQYVTTYDKNKKQRLDIEELIKNRKWNSHIYVCGPERMVEAVLEAGRKFDMPEEEIHYEKFTASHGGDPFTVEVETDNPTKKVEVGEHKSLLEALKDAGFDIPSSCETGSCGTCRIPLKKGRVDHKGTSLSEEEKQNEILTCVSRGIGNIVVELPAEVDIKTAS